MHILIGSPEHNTATGNWVTASRYRTGLEQLGHKINQFHIAGYDQLQQLIDDNQPDLLLLLHGYRTGKPWLQLRQTSLLPTVMMLSGTDVNEGLQNVGQAAVIEMVMHQAEALVVQNGLLLKQLQQRYPEIADHLHFVPPSAELGSKPYPLRQLHKIADDMVVFICPASVRPVKGLLPLLELFDQLAIECPQHMIAWQVVFCGPDLHSTYSNRFFAALERRPWATYLGVIEPDAMPAALNQADVVLNNSISEGLPNTLIEASCLGKPILAHNIIGNRPIVEDGVNGFLYGNSVEFVAAASRLINNAALRQRLSQSRVAEYLPQHEAVALEKVCKTAV